MIVRTPALDAWRLEWVRGERTRTTFDALWRAACCEQNAIEASADGLHDAAAGYLRDAARIIREAADQQRRERGEVV